MSSISDEMKSLFIDTYRLHQQERAYNYQNYGRYPYRDRRSSVQIIADFNADAYIVNGLFVTEESYIQYYPPEIIESVERVLVGVTKKYQSQIERRVVIDGVVRWLEYGDPILVEIERYETVVIREYVEVEAVEVQSMRYLFPFNCVVDLFGSLKLVF